MKNHDHDNNVVALSQFQNKESNQQESTGVGGLIPETKGKVENFTGETRMFYYERLPEKDPTYLQLFVAHLHVSSVIISGKKINNEEILDGSCLISIYDPDEKIFGLSLSISEFIELTCLDPNSVTDILGYLHTYFQSHNITDFKTKFHSFTEQTTFIDNSNIEQFHPEKIIVDLMGDFPIIKCYFYNHDQLYISVKEQDFNIKNETIPLLDMLMLGVYTAGSLSDIENIYIQEKSPDMISNTIIKKEYISHVIESALKGYSWEYRENYKDIEKAIKHYYKTQLEKKLDVEEEYDDENE